MTIDFSNKTSINEIKETLGADGKSFFTEDEKLFLFSTKINGDIKKAKELPGLLAKVKEAENTIKENVVLHGDIEKYKTSTDEEKKIAYDIIEANDFRVTRCLNHLTKFFRSGGKEKTKEEAEARKKELEVERIENQRLKGLKSSQRLAAIKQKERVLRDLDDEKNDLKRKKALKTILTWDRTSTTEEIEFNGTNRKLSDIGSTVNVN